MNKTCPRCGASFVCTHDVHCQCMGIALSSRARAHMREHYNDCLCADCLRQLSQELPD